MKDAGPGLEVDEVEDVDAVVDGSMMGLTERMSEVGLVDHARLEFTALYPAPAFGYAPCLPLQPTRPIMANYVYTMNRVGKIVPPKRQILKDISLSFFPGAKIGVLGLNGSGKSTLPPRAGCRCRFWA